MNLAAAFRFSSSLVAVLDASDGRIVDVNPAFEQVLGFERRAVIGRGTLEIDLWPDPQARAQVWAHLRSEHRVCGRRVVFRGFSGTEFAASLSCEFFEHDGRRLLLALLQDVAPASAADTPAPTDPGSYRALFLASSEGFYRSHPTGGWIDVNPALARIFGYESPVQMLRDAHGIRASDMYADPTIAAALYERLAADGHFENQRAQIRRRDGSLAWVLENSRCVRDAEGHLLFYEGSIMDIGRQVEAEERLRQSENMYRTLVDSSHDGVFLIRHNGTIGFMNEAMAQVLGYRADELIGSNYLNLIAPEALAEQMQRRDERAGGSYAVQIYDTVMLHKDRSRRLLHVHAGAVDYEGEVASTGTARDVTEERRQRQALEWAERTYRELFQSAVSGMFRSLLDGRIVAANDAFANIVGFGSATRLLAAQCNIRDFYANPETRKAVIDKLLASDGPITFEFDARRNDGSTVPAEVRAQAVRDSAGAVQWIEGSAQDIGARRRAEVALKESEARYRTLVEHSQVGVYMMLDDHYTYVNQAFASMFGYTEAELVGADFRLLLPPGSGARIIEDGSWRQHAGMSHGTDYSTVLARKGGERIDVVVSAGRVEMDGKLYTSGTVRDVTAQLRVQRELEHNASHDLLTGLPNRVYFERQLVQAIDHAHATGDYHYALLFLDLDGFKLVNDSLGHASGDELLVRIGETLRTHLGGNCLVARYGGDEFTLLPHGPCTRGRAEKLAQRVLTLLAASFEIKGSRVFSGASVGVVLGRAEYRSTDQLLRDADTAMYRAKASGKSAYVIFDEAMHAAARARLQIETDLRFALERGEFRVHYQPIVDMRRATILGCEALVRWQHPERGCLLPDQFLDVAEEAGALVAVDWWVLEQTCRNLVCWQRRFPAHAALRASVNVDDRQFADPDLVAHLDAILRRTGINPRFLTLEITETVYRRGRREATETLHALKQLGLSLVVDDFGTGYSSLDSFATSPFDALKIDRSFIRDVVTNFRHRAIVRTIAGFADDLALGLIAEGVETSEQADLLLKLGCTSAQGFLYASALPTDAFEVLLENGFMRRGDTSSPAVA
jgi:diguanylate cyclase (GGDEF)-like protein/PAS domain S-box-containing protein